MIEPYARIVSDGQGHKTHVYVGDVEVPASEITWRCRAGGVATATLVVPNVALHGKAQEIVAALPTEEPQYGEVKRLAPLQPGDTVILEVDRSWSTQDAHRAEEYLRSRFPGHEVAIIVGGTLKVSSALPVAES